ncbi:hypothetical protein PRIPAC_88411 [Pristionchus pacificus]|uniref:Uncharacterized protein n=1 Tax=Pristionchus pacificus TaxID=54126 RepID=A0A2A6CTB5_PRIPA|nr:hypothetical protein PRIPAC_88411 [Pristionchus pacificus]|eukprot:PDM81350.1 hypothetical protein PRIPAC_35226 [Pristionchus pacificus]
MRAPGDVTILANKAKGRSGPVRMVVGTENPGAMCGVRFPDQIFITDKEFAWKDANREQLRDILHLNKMFRSNTERDDKSKKRVDKKIADGTILTTVYKAICFVFLKADEKVEKKVQRETVQCTNKESNWNGRLEPPETQYEK